jgi:prohibitin 2
MPIKDEPKSKLRFVPITLIAVFVILFLAASSLAFVGAGERGVLLTWGKVEPNVLGEGLHFKMPIAQSVTNIDVKTQRFSGGASAASKDLQIVSTDIVLNYHLVADDVNDIYQNVGNLKSVEDKVIDPTIQESVKASTALFNAEELITQRPVVKEKIKEILIDRLTQRGIVVEDISITNFEFSPEFSNAIEQKQVAEQEALKAERILQRITIEAQQAREAAAGRADARLIEAKAEAEAINIQGEALRANGEVLQLRQIEKWDGILPRVLLGNDGNSPLILDLGTSS